MMLVAWRKWFLSLLVLLSPFLQAETKPVYLGFDGAYGLLNSTSAQAIEQGIRIALEEINGAGGVLNGRPLTLLTKDSRSVPARGIANFKKFAKQADLVAVIGGRFSTVHLEQVDLAHELKLVLLAAWSSADGITAHKHRPSYTFRLSLRDALAAPAMLGSLEKRGIKRVGLLIPNNGWGRSNHKAAIKYVEKTGRLELLPAVWYNWGEQDMLQHYQALYRAGAEAILLVAPDVEGARLIRQLAGMPETAYVPIVCHWGITGGKFFEESGDTLLKLDLSVVQTFSFFDSQGPVHDRVMRLAERLFGLKRIEDIKSPVGFAHAYDLTHILARAIKLAGSTDRAAIRDALEKVRNYEGLTGFYAQAFSPEDHDALKAEQVFMARYRRDGVIVPIERQ